MGFPRENENTKIGLARRLDQLLNSEHLVFIASLFACTSLVLTPIAAFFDFAYLREGEAPLLLKVMNGIWAAGFVLGGGLFFLLGMIRALRSYGDDENRQGINSLNEPRL